MLEAESSPPQTLNLISDVIISTIVRMKSPLLSHLSIDRILFQHHKQIKKTYDLSQCVNLKPFALPIQIHYLSTRQNTVHFGGN